jgi:hypothetical protein
VALKLLSCRNRVVFIAITLLLAIMGVMPHHVFSAEKKGIQIGAEESPPKAADDIETFFREHPGKFTEEVIAAYRSRRIIPGMDPYIAARAGGAFQYEVEADPSRWPSGSDPLNVIYSQARHPDASQIRMVFENATQFPATGRTRFLVIVEHGLVAKVEKIDGKPESN